MMRPLLPREPSAASATFFSESPARFTAPKDRHDPPRAAFGMRLCLAPKGARVDQCLPVPPVSTQTKAQNIFFSMARVTEGLKWLFNMLGRKSGQCFRSIFITIFFRIRPTFLPSKIELRKRELKFISVVFATHAVYWNSFLFIDELS